jgi:RHS repeat-associated protein
LAGYSFDPWGRRTLTRGSDATPLGFTGHPASGSGVSLTLYRGYDPALGRWLSEDPSSFAGGINLYAYVNNNPTNLQDPLGLAPCAQTPCDELLKDIVRLATEVSQRYEQYNHPKWRLPMSGPRMTRESHIKQIEQVQRGLRNRIQDYNDQNCPTPIPAPLEELATRPTPVLTPSPVHLPELPPPTPQQTRDMGAMLTMGLLMTAALIWWIVFG